MRRTSKGFRLHIGFFGRRNVGKSSLLNMLAQQSVSLVSEVAGTTTDPVEKPMEMLPLGPVLLIDTAGMDDVGLLGKKRVERTRRIYDRTDLGVLVFTSGRWGDCEEEILAELQSRNTPVVIVLNKTDIMKPDPGQIGQIIERGLLCVQTQATRPETVYRLRRALVETAMPDRHAEATILGGLVSPGGMVILVTPVDKEAPKGRLILPQVQTIRDILDRDALCMVVQDGRIADALGCLTRPPDLVVCDSQALDRAAALTPENVALTSFSILFSRLKGDLHAQIRGALSIFALRPGDRVLIAEACSHHPIEDDIGREKLPRWLEEKVGGTLIFEHVRGHDFTNDLCRYKLVIHCGACMWNRKEMLSRILHCSAFGVPITNYGLAIAVCRGVLERVVRPFFKAPLRIEALI